jgi:HPt (histidine-containing phosphotransfer) domain-containing protein
VDAARDSKPSPLPAERGLEIEGLDTSRGIAATGGTLEGYMKVLKTYCRDAEKRLAIMSRAPDEDGLALFITQVHALKSASASIGADEISRMAAALEVAGRGGDMEYIRENLDAFTKNLALTTERIKAGLSKDTAAAPGGEFQGMGESLNPLKDALASENVGEADKILASLSGEPLDEASRDSLSRISDLVLLGEFGEALRIAESLSWNDRPASVLEE